MPMYDKSTFTMTNEDTNLSFQLLSFLAAAIIRVEDELTGEVNDIIVKKEVGAEQEDDIAEEVIVGEGTATIQLEELSQVEEAVQDPQLAEAPPNGDLTPEMILSMMDRHKKKNCEIWEKEDSAQITVNLSKNIVWQKWDTTHLFCVVGPQNEVVRLPVGYGGGGGIGKEEED
ncbi:hypothetical protein WMY93_013283 [Mugilogobius chulae]|uniref:Uncharacterized protein n=1 Tax=Mugilogobius chulae TaxID=88201 RepID=A0AAW0P9I2_9GOBI